MRRFRPSDSELAGQRPTNLLLRPREPSQVDVLLERFADAGLVDDLGYARALVRVRHSGLGHARSAIVRELARRGIDAETAADALGQLDDDAEHES